MNTTSVVSLLVNQLKHAYGVVTPSFSWKIESARQGAAQSAYRIRVFEGRDGEGTPYWDSGEVATDDSFAIRYAGPALKPARAYSWRVAVKDETGTWTESDAAVFETALTDEAAWAKAEWISVWEPHLGDRDTAAFLKPVANAKSVSANANASATTTVGATPATALPATPAVPATAIDPLRRPSVHACF